MGKKSNNALRQARYTPKEERVMAYSTNHKPKREQKPIAMGQLVSDWQEIQRKLGK